VLAWWYDRSAPAMGWKGAKQGRDFLTEGQDQGRSLLTGSITAADSAGLEWSSPWGDWTRHGLSSLLQLNPAEPLHGKYGG